MGIDLLTALAVLIAILVVLLAADLLFAGGGMTGAMMHGGAAMMGSAYGWAIIVALVIVTLVAFGLLFGTK